MISKLALYMNVFLAGLLTAVCVACHAMLVELQGMAQQGPLYRPLLTNVWLLLAAVQTRLTLAARPASAKPRHQLQASARPGVP